MACDNQNEVKDEVVSDITPFDPTKKKKKKKVVIQDTVDDYGAPSYPWEGNTYEELLDRVFNILRDRENNLELAGDRRGIVLRPPQVLREGTNKTVFVNFIDECKMMRREPNHVMNFLLTELGTSGSLDGQQRLVVKGRFAPNNFQGILRRYVIRYVNCNGCKSPDTMLSKKNRLLSLNCEKCGSERSVAQIKAGFQARVGPRNART
ncbi:eukaryotic translation initiation factor 2 subunit beta-like [Prunus avium]|uniref:Eukaryotic translation initiation factor 2 subunit beta n=1 Tax=Prunus avium TaxID=42229 RepID=A0A6P5S2E7_PRUAV|nr:eukaryotic translation initiation factor 2 subunit beta-like [Prunus avium]